MTYQIYCGPIINEDIKSYQRRLSAMPFFLIDSASFIENKDDHWDVYLIFKKTRVSSSSSPCDVHYSIIGFATVYRFFRFPDRTRMRISQFIVFPSYHRQGHPVCWTASTSEANGTGRWTSLWSCSRRTSRSCGLSWTCSVYASTASFSSEKAKW